MALGTVKYYPSYGLGAISSSELPPGMDGFISFGDIKGENVFREFTAGHPSSSSTGPPTKTAPDSWRHGPRVSDVTDD